MIKEYNLPFFIFISIILFTTPCQNFKYQTSYSIPFRSVRQENNIAAEKTLQNIIRKLKQKETLTIKKIANKNFLDLNRDFTFNIRYFIYNNDVVLFYENHPLGIIENVNEKIENLNKIKKTTPIYPITSDERKIIFNLFSKLNGNSYEIIKPYHKAPREKLYWDALTALPQNMEALDRQEAPVRELAVEWLSQLNFKNGSLYDPMCSSGAYLKAINGKFPGAKLYGSDVAKGMIEEAKKRLNGLNNIELFHKDASAELTSNKILPSKIDILVFRGLNERVTTEKKAKEIFKEHIDILKPGSKVFVFGVTDVLIHSDFFKENKFKILNKASYSKRMKHKSSKRGGFFQFYVLEYKGD